MAAHNLAYQVERIAADLAHETGALETEIVVGAFDHQAHFGGAYGVEREVVVEQTDEGADRAGTVVVLGLAEQQRAAALDVAQVDVVAQRGAQHAAGAAHCQHDLRFRIVPLRIRMQADVGAAAHRRHRLRLGEHFGIDAYAHFHVLRPGAAPLQFALQLQRGVRAGPQRRQVRSQRLLQGGAQRGGAGRIAAGLFLDDAFEQADGKRHAASLDRLQIARRQQAWRAGFGLRRQGIVEQRQHRAERLTGGVTGQRQRVRAVEQIGHGGRRRRDVEHLAAAYRDHAGALHRAAAPDASDEDGVVRIGGEQGGGGEFFHRHPGRQIKGKGNALYARTGTILPAGRGCRNYEIHQSAS